MLSRFERCQLWWPQVLRHALDRPQMFRAAVEAVLKGSGDKSQKVSNMAAALRMGFGYKKVRRAAYSQLVPPFTARSSGKLKSLSLIASPVAARAHSYPVMIS